MIILLLLNSHDQSYGLGTFGNQLAFLQQICAQYVNKLNEEQIQSAISTPNNFIQFCNANESNLDLVRFV